MFGVIVRDGVVVTVGENFDAKSKKVALICVEKQLILIVSHELIEVFTIVGVLVDLTRGQFHEHYGTLLIDFNLAYVVRVVAWAHVKRVSVEDGHRLRVCRRCSCVKIVAACDRAAAVRKCHHLNKIVN